MSIFLIEETPVIDITTWERHYSHPLIESFYSSHSYPSYEIVGYSREYTSIRGILLVPSMIKESRNIDSVFHRICEMTINDIDYKYVFNYSRISAWEETSATQGTVIEVACDIEYQNIVKTLQPPVSVNHIKFELGVAPRPRKLKRDLIILKKGM